MRKTRLGKIALIINTVLCISVALLMLTYLLKSENVIAGVFHELIAGSVILGVPAGLVLAVMGFHKDQWAIKSYSFIALILSGLLIASFFVNL